MHRIELTITIHGLLLVCAVQVSHASSHDPSTRKKPLGITTMAKVQVRLEHHDQQIRGLKQKASI